MSNNKTFTAAILTVAKMMALVATIAIASALSRLLDKNTYGAFCQILTIYTMSSIIVRSGLPQSIYYFLPRLKREDQKGLVLQSIFLLILFGLFVGLFLYYASERFGVWWNSETLPVLLRSFCLYPAFILPIMLIESVFMSLNHVFTVFYYNIISKIITFFVVVVPVYLGYSVVVSVRCWVIYAFMQLVVVIILVNRVFKGSKIILSLDVFKSQIKYSLPLSFAAILGAFAAYADKISVSFLGDPSSFATYFNGAFELPFIGVVGGAVTVTVLPLMTEYARNGHYEEFIGLWHRSQLKVAFILFPIWLFSLFFAKDIIAVLFGESYVGSVIIFQVFLFLVPARLCAFNRIVSPINKNWIYTFGHLIQLLVGFVSCFVLYWRIGVIGAAIGIVLSIYANVFFMGYSCAKELKMKFHQMWPLKKLGAYFIVALSSGGVACLICSRLSNSTGYFLVIRLCLGATLTGFIYLCVLHKFGMFDWREWFVMLFSKSPKISKQSNV